MSLTTFVILAISHDPTTMPHQWNWEVLADHPGKVDVIGHVPTETGEVSELIADALRKSLGNAMHRRPH